MSLNYQMYRQEAMFKSLFYVCLLLLANCTIDTDSESGSCEETNNFNGCPAGFECVNFQCVSSRTHETDVTDFIPSRDGGTSNSDLSDDRGYEQILLIEPNTYSRFFRERNVSSGFLPLLHQASVPYLVSTDGDDSPLIDETYFSLFETPCGLREVFEVAIDGSERELFWCQFQPQYRFFDEVTEQVISLDTDNTKVFLATHILPSQMIEVNAQDRLVRVERTSEPIDENESEEETYVVHILKTNERCGLNFCEDDTSRIQIDSNLTIRDMFDVQRNDGIERLVIWLEDGSGSYFHTYERVLGTNTWSARILADDIFINDVVEIVEPSSEKAIAISPRTGYAYELYLDGSRHSEALLYEPDPALLYNSFPNGMIVQRTAAYIFICYPGDNRIWRFDRYALNMPTLIPIPDESFTDVFDDLYYEETSARLWGLRIEEGIIAQIPTGT